ncbi:MAG: GUN4 domain-containing protein [Leptolyngbya sp. SIO1E4]|nr:GUN4 domain-containing protein [Leptolyngbya sp. SIO1E4]
MTTTIAQANYQELDEVLSQEEWQEADEVTLQIMLEAADRRQEGWLDQAAIARFPCEVLHQLDQRWLRYSSGRFGFSSQLQIYTQEVDRMAFAFSRQAGWTISTWRPMGFFKFYDRLTFSLDAPRGHLPALWFWEMPWYMSLQMGGFGTGRGAGFGDASLFDAVMLRLERCQQI